MKEENGSQDVGATAFDLANNQNPEPHAPIFYGSTKVPHPTNAAAKITPKDAVMRAVLEAK